MGCLGVFHVDVNYFPFAILSSFSTTSIKAINFKFGDFLLSLPGNNFDDMLTVNKLDISLVPEFDWYVFVILNFLRKKNCHLS